MANTSHPLPDNAVIGGAPFSVVSESCEDFDGTRVVIHYAVAPGDNRSHVLAALAEKVIPEGVPEACVPWEFHPQMECA